MLKEEKALEKHELSYNECHFLKAFKHSRQNKISKPHFFFFKGKEMEIKQMRQMARWVLSSLDILCFHVIFLF